MTVTSVIIGLKRSCKEELDAERKYRDRAKTADTRSRALWLHVAEQERHHYNEFKMQIRKLEAGKR